MSLTARRVVAGAAVLGLIVAVVVIRGLLSSPPGITERVDAYRGLGTWIDIYDSSWSDPSAAISAMEAQGIRTLFLQTSNFDRSVAFVHPDGVASFLDAAASAGISVVAWYLPGLDDVERDLARSMDAIDYRTADGNAFDGFALDIESTQVKDPAVRTDRLVRLSSDLRSQVGIEYPLGAIIPSPIALQRNTDYWPDFPYRALAQSYDVFLPMTYFTWRASWETDVHAYTAGCIDLIRSGTGDPTVPIHVIGGIAGDASPSETAGFVDAVRERGVLGASFYTFPLTSDGEWRSLDKVPTNPVESPALPLELGSSDAVGDLPGGDTTHPNEVVYATGPHPGGWRLTYQAFDLQKREVSIWVNWHRLSLAAPTDGPDWSSTRGRLVPDGLLNDDATNYIAFVARSGGDPDIGAWGVRLADLVPVAEPPSPSPSPTA